MTGKILAKQFTLNHRVTQVNLNEVDHQASLRHAQVPGNCINWILGHMVASRNAVFQALGEEPVWSDADARRYQRGSQPIRAGDEVLPLERMQADYSASQARLLPLVEGLADEDLVRRRDKDEPSLVEQLVMLAFHETYHAGQIGLMRRVIGMEGAIK